MLSLMYVQSLFQLGAKVGKWEGYYGEQTYLDMSFHFEEKTIFSYQERVYLSSFGFKTSLIYFYEKSQSFKKKSFVVSELCSKEGGGGVVEKYPPVQQWG